MVINDCDVGDEDNEGDEDDKNIARYTKHAIVSWPNPKQ